MHRGGADARGGGACRQAGEGAGIWKNQHVGCIWVFPLNMLHSCPAPAPATIAAAETFQHCCPCLA